MKTFTSLFLAVAILVGCTSRNQNAEETGEETEQVVDPVATDNSEAETDDEPKNLAEKYAEAQFGSLVTNVANQRFGYYIYIDGQIVIEQTTIPAIPGKNGFVTKEDAQKVADLAIAKIRKGNMPPTITVEELKELKIQGLE